MIAISQHLFFKIIQTINNAKYYNSIYYKKISSKKSNL